mgnify:FL=1
MRHKNKKNFLRFPKLRIGYRLLLYFLTVLFVVLSIVSVISDRFAYGISVVCYTLAAVALFVSSYYLILDIRYIVKDIVKPKIKANPFADRMTADYRLRTVLFAVPGLTGNIIFAVFSVGVQGDNTLQAA